MVIYGIFFIKINLEMDNFIFFIVLQVRLDTNIQTEKKNIEIPNVEHFPINYKKIEIQKKKIKMFLNMRYSNTKHIQNIRNYCVYAHILLSSYRINIDADGWM